MNLGWLKSLWVGTKQFGIRNASHILMAVGTGTSLSAVISAIKANPEVKSVLFCKRVERTAQRMGKRFTDIYEDCEKGRIRLEKLSAWEIIGIYVKLYGISALMELIALVCFWGAHGIDIRRQMVLSGIAATAEEALREYQSKTRQMIGEEAEKEVRNQLAQDVVDKTPPINTVILPGNAETEFIIGSPPQRFRATYTQVKDAQNDANWEMLQNMYVSESELFWMLDPEKKYLKPDWDSGQVGWNLDKMLVLDIGWGSNPDHSPVGVITYRDKDGNRYDPKPNFGRLM